MTKHVVTFSCGHHGIMPIAGKPSEQASKLAWCQEQAVCPACYWARLQAELEAQDIAEHIISLPTGKAQAFIQTSEGHYYVKGTKFYFTQAQWDEGKAKAIAAGATIITQILQEVEHSED